MKSETEEEGDKGKAPEPKEEAVSLKEDRGPIMPPSILKQMNELSGGCFFFLTIDADGEPELYIKADNSTMRIGLIQRLSSVVSALKSSTAVESEVWKTDFLQSMGIHEIPPMMIDDDDDDDFDLE